jgi:hypothetical protein
MGWWAERASLEMGMESRGAMVEVWWVKVRKEDVSQVLLGWRVGSEG